MTYSEESMKFWKVLYRLFHGKALRFMSGLKSTGQVTGNETEKGCFDPQNTAINFAVPNQNSIVVFETVDVAIPKEIAPGVIPQAMDMKDKSKSYFLGFDGFFRCGGTESRMLEPSVGSREPGRGEYERGSNPRIF